MTKCTFIHWLILYFFQELEISLLHWLLTIFAMTLGELNYADNFMPLEYPFAELINALFILFVLAMPIILMNMLVRAVVLHLCAFLSTEELSMLA